MIILRILHLSDVHYSLGQKNFKKYVSDPLFKDISHFHENKPFDLVVFTGDLLDKGGLPNNTIDSFESFEREFISKLLSILKLPKDRFVFIPGNHDVNRSRINPATEEGLKSLLKDKESIEYHMQKPSNLNLERLEEYKIFENIYYDDYEGYKSNDFGYSLVLPINNITVGIAGFNSSWRCYNDKDKGNLIIGKKQFKHVDEHFQINEPEFKIALIHHPFEFLCESEYEETKDYIIRDYDLLFTGHTHQSNAQSITTSLGKGCVLCSAPSNWEKNNFQNHGLNRNGYNIIDYIHNPKSVNIKFRRYNYEKDCFVSNTDMGTGDSAEVSFTMGDNLAREAWIEYSNTIRFIKDHFLESIDQNLVSYNTDTNAPKHLKDLFVLPKIKKHDYQPTDANEYVEYEENLEFQTIENLCNQKNHLVLFGPSESGKTTILYKIASEVLERAHLSRKIPIYIDLKTISTKSLLQQIALFIGQNKKSTNDILGKYESILLLDNLRYVINNGNLFDELKRIIEAYPKLKIIGTYDSVFNENLPAEYLNHPISKIFDRAIIEYFKSLEIHTLMQRWFNLSKDNIEDEHLSQIIKNFHLLNIPSTPLAVSLFLWIYEKQKGFIPLNNAAMVQNFVEKLFEKHSDLEVHSSKFDFHNKENLLGHIAMEMYKISAEDYVIEEDILRSFIKELNKRKKIGLENKENQVFHEWVIHYFVEKGIFISEIVDGTRVYKFKLNCFFQYYLAKGMMFSKEFKEHVLSEENFLIFQDEIDYYSGLHRYDGDILEISLDRMENEFSKIFKDPDSFKQIHNNPKMFFPFDLMFAKGPVHENKLLIEDIEEEKIGTYLDDNKISDEEKLNSHDLLLESSNHVQENTSVVNKIPQNQLSKLEILQRSWILSAKILKNVEDLEDGELKDRAYRSIIVCSLIFLKITTLSAEEIIKNNKDNNEHSQFYNFFVRFSLLLHQNLLFTVMGTSKLTPVIEDYLANEEAEYSNVERFISLFLLIDSGATNFEEVNYALQNHLSSAVREFVLVKLTLLDAQTKNKAHEKYYREKINNLLKKNNEGKHIISKQKVLNKHQVNSKKKLLLATVSER